MDKRPQEVEVTQVGIIESGMVYDLGTKHYSRDWDLYKYTETIARKVKYNIIS